MTLAGLFVIAVIKLIRPHIWWEEDVCYALAGAFDKIRVSEVQGNFKGTVSHKGRAKTSIVS